MVSIPLKAKAANERDVFCWIEKGESFNVTYAKGASFGIYNDKKIVRVKKNKTKFTVKGLKVGSTEVDIKDSKKKIIGTIHVTVVKSGRKAITNATATVTYTNKAFQINPI